MPSDATAYLLAAAALVVASYSYQHNQELTAKINTCETQFEGFKQGVIYGK
jgi:type VI protein secretion system component VasK